MLQCLVGMNSPFSIFLSMTALLDVGGVPIRGNHLAQHPLHRQRRLHPSHQQEAHRLVLPTGRGEQVRACTHSVMQGLWTLSSDFPPSLTLCSFPHATDETLLAKFKQQHLGNKYFVPTQVMEPAFVIQHFAGKVKYQIKVRCREQSKAPLDSLYSNKSLSLKTIIFVKVFLVLFQLCLCHL